MGEEGLAEGALSVPGFCERFGVSRTYVYDEIKSGRLVARKAGGRTLIMRSEAAAWAGGLPLLKTAAKTA